MSYYEDLVTYTQLNYSAHFQTYATGGTPYELSDRPAAPYDEQVDAFIEAVRSADHIVVGGASGLSAAGCGDFYYEDNASYRRYFGPFAERYGFQGAFAGMQHRWPTRGEFWAYLATFLNATLSAPVRRPYLDLQTILAGRDFHIVTSNQDTQFIKAFDEADVSELQGDHRYFQCAACCHDGTWDAVETVRRMVSAIDPETLSIPDDMIPRCPRCGGEAFPWVRGYGNFLQGRRYERQYGKISDYLTGIGRDASVLYLELGVGRMTPMFIQEPFWNLTAMNPNARYIAVNDRYAFLPRQIEDRGMAIRGDIAQVLDDVAARLTVPVSR